MSLNLCQLEAPICAVGVKDHGFKTKEMQNKKINKSGIVSWNLRNDCGV